jgi:hypothetical protein
MRLNLRRNLIIIGIVAALFSATLSAYAWWRETPSLLSLAPNTAVGIAEVDAPWWWQASAQLRDQKNLKQGLKSFETASSLSIEKDILPWAGHVGGILLPNAQKYGSPHFALFFEIKDLPSFGRTLLQFQKTTGGPSGKKWKTQLYHGCEVTSLGEDVESTIIKSWFVIGEPSTVKQVIDTYSGSIPSLETSEGWKTALNQIPDDKALFFGMDYSKFLTMTLPAGKDGTPQGMTPEIMKMSHFVEGVSLSATESGLRFDVAAVPTSPELKSMMAKQAQAIRPVTAAHFKQIPSDATAAFVFGGFGPTWEEVANQNLKLIDNLPASSIPQGLPFGLTPKKIGSIAISFIKPYSEGGALSVVANRQNGVGVVFSGLTPSADKAQNTADGLQLLLQIFGMSADSHDGIYSVKLPASVGSLPFDLSPSFKTEDTVLRFSSSSKLLSDPIGATKLKFPAEAEGACGVAVGNFDFLDVVPKAPDVAKTLDMLKISNADWCFYSKTASDGSWSNGALVLNNWDYHNGLALMVKSMDDHDAAAAAAAARYRRQEIERQRSYELQRAKAKAAHKNHPKSKITRKAHRRAKTKSPAHTKTHAK